MVSNVLAVAFAASVVQMATARPAYASIKVVGGNTSDASNRFPFAAALSNKGKFICGGSLVDGQTVVTAAHCIRSPNDVGGLQIRVGSLAPTSGGTVVGVVSAELHPEWNPAIIDNDIAMLKLSESVLQLSKSVSDDQTVGLASLPEQNSDPTEGTNTIVAGWGVTKEDSKNPSRRLREVAVPVVDRDRCKRADQVQPKGVLVTENMFCAGLQEGGKDSCQGDSGGPIIDGDTGTLVGIVSKGVGCARANKFGVYTRLGNYVDFIKANLAN